MRVVVLGAGALGSFFGGVLARKHDVTLVGRDPHMAAVDGEGLRVTGMTDLHVRPDAVTDAAAAGVPDVLLVTTKAYDTATALDDAAPLLGEATVVASLQNGLGNLEALADRVPADRVVGGVTTHGVTHEGPGVVRHAGQGDVVLGTLGGDGEGAADRVADALRSAGLDAEVTDRIRGEVWAKVVVNAGINPLTAVTGLRNGALVEEEPLEELMAAACREAVAVARAEGVDLPDVDLVERTRQVAGATAGNKSSMLQDVERGRRTEIDAINGEVARRGRELGVETPVNRTLWALVRGIEATTRRA